MENGGNDKVNAIFEARLAQSGRNKLTNLADGPTRERFIRDKYERRKFYDPAGYALAGNAGVPQAPSSGPSAITSARPGAPSDVARQRVASRQARMKPSQSQMEAPARAAKPIVAQAPVSAPVVLDLLDFGSSDPAPAAVANDPFAAPTSIQAPVSSSDPFAPQPSQPVAQPKITPPVQPPKPQQPSPRSRSTG